MSENTKFRFRFWTRAGQALGGIGMLGAILMADLTNASPAILIPLVFVSGSLFLKGMITAIENSNSGFKFNWDDPQNEKLLAGKLVGVVFGEEEYMHDQEVKTAVKPFWMCSVDKIREGVEIPKKKTLKPQQDLMGGYLDEDFHLIPEGDDDVPF